MMWLSRCDFPLNCPSLDSNPPSIQRTKWNRDVAMVAWALVELAGKASTQENQTHNTLRLETAIPYFIDTLRAQTRVGCR